MKAHEFITEQKLDEIDRLSPDIYTGGKTHLKAGDYARKYIPLPGGSGLLYTIDDLSNEPMIRLWDPNGAEADPKPYRVAGEFADVFAARMKKWEDRQKSGKRIPQLVGKLTLETPHDFPIKKALQVGTITVHEDYRGMGLAKALYGIVLTIMKRPLVAGISQTPGGRKNWVSLSKIPGVEMKGYVRIPDAELTDELIDIIMGKLGGQYIGSDYFWAKSFYFFAFDVQPTTTDNEIKAYIDTELNQVYDPETGYEVGLYAIWTGQ